jgi:GNAT superfamily N-acetyltransferase
MAASNIEIRPIQADERAAWEPLWKGYQAFYQVAIPDETTNVTWARLHDPAEPMDVLGAYVDGRLCGIVHYLFHRSCWTIGNYCYLQDLFVAEDVRNLGVGRALILAVEARARAAGASRVYWHTHETNARARALYDQLAERPGFIEYCMLF